MSAEATVILIGNEHVPIHRTVSETVRWEVYERDDSSKGDRP